MANRRRQQDLGDGDRAAHAQRAARLLARLLDDLAGRLGLIEHGAAAFVEGFAKRRNAHLPCRAAQQLDAQVAFQLGNAAAQARLGHA
ncbi:hypothetical protein D3C85_1578230 [compost metagenome]